ncbi:HAD family hydrolase [Bacillus cereus]
MINKVSTVIFDLDGTLVNSWKIHLESCKYAYSRVMNKTCSTLLIKRYAMPTEEATLGCLVGEENKERALKFYNKYFLDNLCELFLIPPIDIHNMLEYLKDRKMKLGIFTGRSRETTYALLKYTDLIKYFDVIITSSDNIPSKPNPDGLALAIEMLEAKKKKVYLLGIQRVIWI